MRSAHRVSFEKSSLQGLVGKISLDGVQDHDLDIVEGDLLSLKTANDFAIQFNQDERVQRIKNATVSFLSPQALRLCKATPKVYLPLEPNLKGRFQKFNSNNGWVASDSSETPQEFSHFSYHVSERAKLVVDIQGTKTMNGRGRVVYLLTDPQVHTNHGKGYGLGNTGKKGILAFFKSHQCTEVCQSFKKPR